MGKYQGICQSGVLTSPLYTFKRYFSQIHIYPLGKNTLAEASYITLKKKMAQKPYTALIIFHIRNVCKSTHAAGRDQKEEGWCGEERANGPHHHYEFSGAVHSVPRSASLVSLSHFSLGWPALVFVERKYIRAHSFHFRFVSQCGPGTWRGGGGSQGVAMTMSRL